MGKPITFAQDPIAIFLEYQLPQMVAQAREAEKNRVHDKDMVIAREESLMRTNEHSNELKEESVLNQLNYDIALTDRDKKIKRIETGQQKLLDQGIMLSQFQNLKDEDTSYEAGEIFQLVQGETKRDVLNSLDELKSIEGGIEQIRSKDAQLDESIDILNKIQGAQSIGRIQGERITQDLTGDKMVTEDDFLQYLINHKETEDTDLFDRSTVEGQLQYDAFMEQIPGLNETTKIGKEVWQTQKLMKETELLDYKGELKNKELRYQALGLGNLNDNINSEIGDMATWFSKKGLADDFLEASMTKLTGLKTDKTEQLSANELQDIMNVLEANIFNQLEASEGEKGFFSGDATANKMEEILEKYFAAESTANKEGQITQLMNLNNYIEANGREVLYNELDYEFGPSGEFTDEANIIMKELEFWKYLHKVKAIKEGDDRALHTP